MIRELDIWIYGETMFKQTEEVAWNTVMLKHVMDGGRKQDQCNWNGVKQLNSKRIS